MALMVILVAAGILRVDVFRRLRALLPHRAEEPDLDMVARLLLVAVSSGMPLSGAIDRVSRDTTGPIASILVELARTARLDGVAAALLAAPRELSPLAPLLARAHLSGASVTTAMETYLEQHRRAVIAAAIARARRAGVLLVIPLALLLLPGFVLVVFGPPIASQVGEFLVTP